MQANIQVEKKEDLTHYSGDAGLVEIWTKEIENAINYEKKWHDEAEDNFAIHNNEGQSEDRYNVFWSNTQTLRPLLFSRLPKANITQRFLDDNETNRIASEMMERSIDLYLKDSDAETVISKCRDDFLIGGRGVARVCYDPESEVELEDGSIEMDDSEKKCRIEYVDWKHFRMSTDKEWCNVKWIAFRHYKNRSELIEDFGEKKGNAVELNSTRLNNNKNKNNENELFKMAEVWEIWDKESRSVLFLAINGGGVLLSNEEDPYNLKNFFPVASPLGSNSNPIDLRPIPLYRQYKAQAEELNLIDVRIRSLVEQCKVTGIYSSIAEASDMEGLFNGNDGSFTPMLSTGNQRVQDLIMFKPLGEIIATIAQLNDRKDRVIFSIRDITGISDIVRGVTTASETATAQQLKGNFAISRIQPLQKELEFWVRDLIRLLCELTVENYGLDELAQMTQLKIVDIKAIERAEQLKIDAFILNEAKSSTDLNNPEEVARLEQINEQAKEQFKKTMKKPLEDLKGYAITPEQIPELEKLIRNDRLRTFAIDVETDSTIKIDQQQEKADRIEYIRSISEFSNSFFPMVQAGIITPDAFKQFMLFISKPFKVGRMVEESLVEQEEQEPKGPSVEEMLAQAEIQIKQQELQLKAQKQEIDAQFTQQELDIKKAALLQEQSIHQDNLEFEDSNKAADREHQLVKDITGARTALMNSQAMAQTENLNQTIRESNKQTFI
jgi:hypothetical protein